MTTAEKNSELENERLADKRYMAKMLARARRPVGVDGPRNLGWTGDGLPTRNHEAIKGLIGRIALQAPNVPILDGAADFYIGDKHTELDGIDVFSWTAPIACTFFRGTDHHELCDDVAVIRTLIRRNGQVTDFTDDVVADHAPAQPFRRRGLSIPAPPTSVRLPSTPGAKNGKPVHGEQKSSPADHVHQHGESDPEHQPVRAEAALRAQITAPRSKGLSPVLATLQPDQYDLVTVPATDNMIIEGKPGTGKTIIASHRAAYLVHKNTPSEKKIDGNVLLIGPTTGYSEHVRGVVSDLVGESDRLRVLSLPELWQEILDLDWQPVGDISTTWRDVDWELGRFARRAIARLTNATGAAPSAQQIYDYLRSNQAITADPEWNAYLRSLPEFRHAKMTRAHSPLLAFIHWETNPLASLKNVQHIIIDEAQDVTPLGWFLLDEINVGDRWTILGDLHQRRSDHTPADWGPILDLIAIDENTPVHTLRRGYRSTRPILEFANRLLPRRDRDVFAFQDEGPAPAVEKVRRAELGDAVLAQVHRLTDAYSEGTVAVIGPDTRAVTETLRSRGWSGSRHYASPWELDGREVTVLDPDSARGIEFDAVVVVEPASFKQNFGRQGPLYTALTRANREVVVVYSKALPDVLRRR